MITDKKRTIVELAVHRLLKAGYLVAKERETGTWLTDDFHTITQSMLTHPWERLVCVKDGVVGFVAFAYDGSHENLVESYTTNLKDVLEPVVLEARKLDNLALKDAIQAVLDEAARNPLRDDSLLEEALYYLRNAYEAEYGEYESE